jgi:uncharacterized protein
MRLDPRSPLVVNTHELGRRPGSMRTLELSVPAPEGLGIEVIGVPAGAPVELRLRLEAVMEGVLASGRAEVTLSGECARCLEPLEEALEVSVQELYVYPESEAEEDEASRLDGELLDLEPALRDAVVLALPFRPVCTPDCPGLCIECGVRLSEHPGHAHDKTVDLRWAALSMLTTNAADGSVSTDEE